MMIMRIATFDQKPDVDPEKHAAFRAWMGSQPGFKAGYHASDPRTGKVVSVSVWESREHMMALKDKVPPGGPLGLKPTTVEFLEVEATF